MQRVQLQSLNDFDEWRAVARALLLAAVPPEAVSFAEPGTADDLFAEPFVAPPAVTRRAVGTVPERFVELAETAICHSDPIRFGLLYKLLWRLQKEKSFLEIKSDPDIVKLDRLVSGVRHDAHKMTAFVRFRSLGIGDDGRERFAAWFEPEHYVVERTAPFFMRRFAGMDWAIVTPYVTAVWNGEALSFGAGGRKADVPGEDAIEAVWRTYFASIFNPARLKVQMMKSEMPVKYWRNLPEAELIPSLIRGAKQAEEDMIARAASQPPTRHARMEMRRPVDEPLAESDIRSLSQAREAIDECRRCPLYEFATQAVFGEGPAQAPMMVVGEQPGDQEDLAGRPFVGPAGKVFDQAADEAGIDRQKVYVTNAVKHFKFTPRGKRRIHQKPNAGEIRACRFWLDLERDFVKPKVIVAMGATAVNGVLGKSATIRSLREEPLQLEDGTWLVVTIHPSYLLRMTDRSDVERERRQFVADLARAQALLEKARAA